MRKVVYGGAMSLDGFIAGPNGEYDWIVMDRDIDFAALMGRFDTFLIGRKTFEVMRGMGGAGKSAKGIRNIVCSRTLRPEDCPGATLTDDAAATVADLRTKPGKDISRVWRRRSLQEPAGGRARRRGERRGDSRPARRRRAIAGGAGRSRQADLTTHRVYEKTGTVRLDYDVVRRKRKK